MNELTLNLTGIDLRDRAQKVAKQLDPKLLRASILSATLDAGESLQDDLNCYLTVQNLEKLCGNQPLFKNPTPELASGDYFIGYVMGTNEPFPFFLREEEMIKHVIIAGSSGAGKTNVGFLLVRQFLEKDKPFMIFDWKRNFRDIVNLPEAAREEILTFTLGRDLCPFHFNPLIPPPGTSPHVWLGKLIEIMAHAFFLGEGVIYILSKALDQVYSQFGVYEASGVWPTFRDVLSFLENYECKGRETQWLASALRAVSMLCFGELDRILNEGHYPIYKLLDQNVILELDALTDTAKIFVTETLLLWIHHYRMAQGKRERFKHACLIEEAHHILSRKLQMISGTETITDMILREVREFGESLIIVDQDPSLLSIPAIGNTYTTIAMNQKERNDVNLMAACLNLDPNEKDILTKLPVGQAVLKLQGRHSDPFLIDIPKVEVEKGAVTDEEVKERMAPFYEKFLKTEQKTALIKEIAENPKNAPWIKEEKDKKKEAKKKDESRKANNNEPSESKNMEKAKAEELSDAERELLVDIYLNELSRVGEHYQRIGIEEARGNKIRQLLESRGLIKSVTLPNLEGRGYWGKALELTKNGRAAISYAENFRLPDEISKRKGNLIHQHYLRLITEKLTQAGHNVRIEHLLGNGEAADLLVDGQIAVELERSDRNTLQNVRKNLEKGFRVIVIAETSALKKRISALLKENSLQESVSLIELKDFSKEKGSQLIHSLFSSPFPPSRLEMRKQARFQERPKEKDESE